MEVEVVLFCSWVPQVWLEVWAWGQEWGIGMGEVRGLMRF